MLQNNEQITMELVQNIFSECRMKKESHIQYALQFEQEIIFM